MNILMRNPFENHGTPVFGDEFIGRQSILNFVRQRLFLPRLAGCAGIFGQPRVGKTSVAYEAVLKKADLFLSKCRLPLKLSIKGFETCDEFFFSLVDAVNVGVQRNKWVIPGFEGLVKAAQRMGPGHLLRLQLVFESLLEAGYQCVIVLDDFDGAAKVFKDRPDCFEKLRVLGSDYRVAWMTLSRRNVYEIEDRATGGSIFAGIIDQWPLGLFNDDEFGAFKKLVEEFGGELSVRETRILEDSCGRHPHLLAMVACDLVESKLEGSRRGLDELLRGRSTDFLTNFEHTVAALRDDRRLSKVFQILFGPSVDVESEDVNVCTSYGLIQLTERDPNIGAEYIAYSQRFGDYLQSIERRHIEGDVWTVWVQTESALRRLVIETMAQKYGQSWETVMRDTQPARKVMIEKWYASQMREEKSLGTRSMNAAIDYSHVADLFTLIFDEWSTLQSVFGQTEAYWRQRAEMLIRVRIALAHNRRVFRDQKTIVQGYCEEVLRVLLPTQELALQVSTGANECAPI